MTLSASLLLLLNTSFVNNFNRMLMSVSRAIDEQTKCHTTGP